MSQDRTANFYTFTDHHGTTQINYYPHAPGPIIQGQGTGPRLQYEGPEGSFVYPQAGPGREHINVQQDSVLGPQVNVVLVPTIDAKDGTLFALGTCHDRRCRCATRGRCRYSRRSRSLQGGTAR